MKLMFFYSLIIFLLLSCANNNSKNNPLLIDSTWQKKNVSSVLTISLPDSSTYNHQGILNAYFGNGKLGLYGVDYYDTGIAYVQNDKEFESALKGYMTGKFTDPELKKYDFIITDTTIGNSIGYFFRGFTNDSLIPCKYPFCFLTLANFRFYWFYACQNTEELTNETKQFYSSIIFNKEEISEKKYQLSPITMYKKAK